MKKSNTVKKLFISAALLGFCTVSLAEECKKTNIPDIPDLPFHETEQLESDVSENQEAAARGYWECRAYDVGWEEHGPHSAVAILLPIAKITACNECLNYHGKCLVRCERH